MTPSYWFPKRYSDVAQRLRAPIGFVLAAAFVYWADPSVDSLWRGAAVSIVGLLLRGWAAGHLAKNHRLATSGPYARTRNPLYLGTLLVAGGLAVSSRQWGLAILFAAAFGLVYLPAIELEEQHLRSLFPEYANFAARVPRLGFNLSGKSSAAKFQFALYLQNEEYKALIGYLLGFALLSWKALS